MRRRLDRINVVGAVTVAAAWERSRTGTYRATATFEREAPDGRWLEVGVEDLEP